MSLKNMIYGLLLGGPMDGRKVRMARHISFLQFHPATAMKDFPNDVIDLSAVGSDGLSAEAHGILPNGFLHYERTVGFVRGMATYMYKGKS